MASASFSLRCRLPADHVIAGRAYAGYGCRMIRFVLRILATVSLAVAVIQAVLDATRSVAMSRLVLTPLGKSWKAVAPEALDSARAAMESHWPFFWDTIVTRVLAVPGFAVFAVLALILYAAGHRPERRGYFAAD
jgi:CubicO group peptidase (beta-lactamase class C family)